MTRRSGDLPGGGDGRARPVQALIPEERFSDGSSQALIPDERFSDGFSLAPMVLAVSNRHDDDIRETLKTDPLGQEILKALRDKVRTHKVVPLGECEVKDGLLFVHGLLYVPDDPTIRLQVLKSCHDHPAAGHPGRAATYELVARDY